jgi:hypothetical protein
LDFGLIDYSSLFGPPLSDCNEWEYYFYKMERSNEHFFEMYEKVCAVH